MRGYPKGRPDIPTVSYLLPREHWAKTCGEKLCVNPEHQRIKTHTSWWLEHTTENEQGCMILSKDHPIDVAIDRTGGGTQRGTCHERCINPAHRINVPTGERPGWMLTEDWNEFQLRKGLKTPDAMVQWLREQDAWVHPSYLGRTWSTRPLKELDFKKVSSGRGRPKKYYRINELERTRD